MLRSLSFCTHYIFLHPTKWGMKGNFSQKEDRHALRSSYMVPMLCIQQTCGLMILFISNVLTNSSLCLLQKPQSQREEV